MSNNNIADEPAAGSQTAEKVRTTKTVQKVGEKAGAEANHELPEPQRKIVAEIGRIHGDLCEATRLTAKKAVEIGERLIGLKKAVGHGNWLSFVERHLPFTEKTAERYMKVYKHRAVLADKFDNMSNFRVSEAYEALTRPKKKAEAAPRQSVDDPRTGGEGGEERERAAILTEIQRTVVARLEDLTPKLLERFESDLRVFLERWLDDHRAEAQS